MFRNSITGFVYVLALRRGLAAKIALTASGRVYDLFALARGAFIHLRIAAVGLTEQQAHAKRATKSKTRC